MKASDLTKARSLIEQNQKMCEEKWNEYFSQVPRIEIIATEVQFTKDMICLVLSDGREVKTPLEFYPLLAKATEAQLKNCRLMGGGTGIHWNELDEDLSVESIVLGRKAYNYSKVS